MKTHVAWKTRERGAALIVALIFLVVLTMLGTSASMNNSLQERMAGNARNRDLAFQAAELALKEAVDATLASEPSLTCPETTPSASDGLRCENGSNPNDGNYWRNTFDWSSTDLFALSGVANVAEQPLYVVEKMPSAPCPGGTPPSCDFYRVTARGVGGTSDLIVILQAMYRF